MAENNDKKEEKKPESELRKRIRKMLESYYVQITMTVFTVYILFADDVKMIATNVNADDTFSAICLAIMCLFAIELAISCYVLDNYVFGFYFWLDLISLISMLLDISWFYSALVSQISGSSGNAKSIAAIAKDGRGAKVGSRAIRILRILRIIRLVRISKLYKASEKYLEMALEEKKKKKNLEMNEKKYDKVNPENKNGASVEMGDEKREEGQQILVPEESKVGKKLSDLTTRRVIILVLSMMIGIILFNSSFYYEMLNSMDFGIKIFEEFDTVNDPNFNLTFDIYVSEHKEISTPIIYARISNITYGNFSDIDILRDDEKIQSGTNCTTLGIEFQNSFPDMTDSFAVKYYNLVHCNI
jgi:hypothetical protein